MLSLKYCEFSYLNIIFTILENSDYVIFQISSTEPITVFEFLFHLMDCLV